MINVVESLKQEIALRDQIDATASRLEGLNISNNSRESRVPKCTELDSDDDDDDVERIDEELLDFSGNLEKSSFPDKNVEKEKDFIKVNGNEEHAKYVLYEL